MKPHKRNGRVAKQRRQETAKDRATMTQQWVDRCMDMAPEDRLIMAIFGAWEPCEECLNEKLVGTDCQSPPCKALRDQPSVFYDKVTDDEIVINGVSMQAGVDY